MEKISKMDEIPEFYVTNRTFEQVCAYVNLTESDLKNLPSDACVLEIGSGVFQNFARGLKEIRPDIHVFSIDPSLSIGMDGKNDFNLKILRDESGNINSAIYNKKTVNEGFFSSFFPPKEEISEDLQSLQELRHQEAIKTGNVLSALAPELPIQESSIDLIIDVYGPGFYIQLNQNDEIDTYFNEVYRVLKIGGELRIFPAFDVNLFLKRSEVDLEFAREFSKIFFLRLFEKNDLKFEINFIPIIDPKNSEISNVLVLKKVENI